MGWVKKPVMATEDIFNALINRFGKAWKAEYMTSENGSPYEYFSDYIRDYYNVTIKQCDELCVMLKKHYHIKYFYYNELKSK